MIEVRRLLPSDDRASFRSGNDDLDRFFHRFAGQNQFRHHIGTTWIAHDGTRIVGFVTVCATEIAAGSRPELRRLPAYPLPVLRIARLAVGAEAQGRGTGSLLLDAAFQIASKMADDLGCVGVVVDAKADAVGWYERLGFRRMEVVGGELGDRPVPAAMFLPLGEMPRR